MDKRKTKRILRSLINSLPNKDMIKDYEFCCSRDFDYGAKSYSGINLHYFNVIKRNTIYLVPKRDYESLWISE